MLCEKGKPQCGSNKWSTWATQTFLPLQVNKWAWGKPRPHWRWLQRRAGVRSRFEWCLLRRWVWLLSKDGESRGTLGREVRTGGQVPGSGAMCWCVHSPEEERQTVQSSLCTDDKDERPGLRAHVDPSGYVLQVIGCSASSGRRWPCWPGVSAAQAVELHSGFQMDVSSDGIAVCSSCAQGRGLSSLCCIICCYRSNTFLNDYLSWSQHHPVYPQPPPSLLPAACTLSVNRK